MVHTFHDLDKKGTISPGVFQTWKLLNRICDKVIQDHPSVNPQNQGYLIYLNQMTFSTRPLQHEETKFRIYVIYRYIYIQYIFP